MVWVMKFCVPVDDSMEFVVLAQESSGLCNDLLLHGTARGMWVMKLYNVLDVA